MEQSPLSHSIRNLEAELGVKLFQRTTRRTWLTAVGARFYREARRILRDIDAATAAAKRENIRKPNLVRLALGEDLASEPFTRLLFELENHEPAIDLEVRELAHTDAIRLVRDRCADVAITLNGRTEAELKRVRAWSEPLLVIAPMGHAFAERDRISLREFASETLALPSVDDRPGYLAQVEGLFNRHGVKPAETRQVLHCNTAVSFAATGHAIALFPATMVNTATTVASVPIAEADAELVTWLFYREDEVSPAASLVLEKAEVIARESFWPAEY